MTRSSTFILASIAGYILLLNAGGFAKSSNTSIVEIARFSMMDLDGWQSKIFAGETRYSLAEEDQKFYLQAHSIQSASALYKKVNVDLRTTPYLNWSWRVDNPLTPLLTKRL